MVGLVKQLIALSSFIFLAFFKIFFSFGVRLALSNGLSSKQAF